jgi:methylphosphotriester-DNA--protein-cysteine methyltransferase
MKNRRRAIILSIIFLFLFAAIFAAFAQPAEFWGSKKSDKYHYPTCEWAQKISPSNLIIFKSPEEARQAGYIPCRVCNPPFSGKK